MREDRAHVAADPSRGSTAHPQGDVIVDLIIAIHDLRRPLGAAISSLRCQGLTLGSELRVTVVCHNIAIDEIAAILSPDDRDAVRLIPCADGIPSPAGPFNAGIAAATARYVAVMGSDDTLEPGALAAWVARAERGGFGAVIAPMVLDSGATVRTPPRRPGRRGPLHPVRDRLAYRTAPLGIVRRDVIEQLGLRFTPELMTGEDLAFSLRLWFAGQRIVYGTGDPRYRVGTGGGDLRVTGTARPIAQVIRAIENLVDDGWMRALPLAARRAIVVKVTRVHLFALANRGASPGGWRPGEREHLADVIRRLLEAAPSASDVLSRADRDLLDALSDTTTSGDELVRLASRRRRFGTPATVFTRSPRFMFAREAPVRFMVASALV